MFLPYAVSHKLITNTTTLEELKALSKENLLEVLTDGKELFCSQKYDKSYVLGFAKCLKKYIIYIIHILRDRIYTIIYCVLLSPQL